MTKSNPQLSKEVIYLQVGETQEGEERTWCEDKINETDIKYIRADKVAQEIESARREERHRIESKCGFQYPQPKEDCDHPTKAMTIIEGFLCEYCGTIWNDKRRVEKNKKLKEEMGYSTPPDTK